MDSERFELSLEQRKALFTSTNERSDRIFQKFLIGSFILGLVLAAIYDTWFVAFGVGGLSVAAFYISKLLLPQSKLYQYVGSAIMAVFMAQYIYQMHGLFEMHFFAFVACTVMITYSNWRLQIPLFIVIVLHHAVFAYLQFIGIEGIFFTQLPYMELSTFILHASLAGLIIFICGLWGYYSEKKIINDGIRALTAESVLANNLEIAEIIKAGDYESEIKKGSDDPLYLALIEMRSSLKENAEREELERYSSQGVSIISHLLTEINTYTKKFGREKYLEKILTELATHLNARQGTLFLLQQDEEEPYLQLLAGYAYEKRKFIKNKIPLGEGLIGQAALEKKHIIVRDLPEDFFLISSSLGSSYPKEVVAWPLLADNQLIGVIEFASFQEFEEKHFNFLEEASMRIASNIAMTEAQIKTTQLLQESEALKLNLEENNAQLEAQAEKLIQSENDLRKQQDNLIEANEELEAQTKELELQKKALIAQNEEIETARGDLMIKAEELESSNAYKSEFLANMSHELRTPLNSILILANILAENKGDRLNDKDVSHAKVIHKAGNDLLTLINDILDLSKIEAGKLDLLMEAVGFEEVLQDMDHLFSHVAEQKEIKLNMGIGDDIPELFESDRVRLEQILKNLLSNACKFTDKSGEVSLNISKASPSQVYRSEALQASKDVIAFTVQDTGIGIPKEKQEHIFSAFSQEDGSTSRKYGGTGLGLSISVQLSQLLGGEIQLESEKNVGSTFTLFLPFNAPSGQKHLQKTSTKVKRPQNHHARRNSASKILIVEDQEAQNQAIGQLLERNNYAYTQAFNGKESLALLKEEKEIDCIILDYNLPDMTGLEILQQIRSEETLTQVPVIIHTAADLNQDIQQELMKFTHTIITKASQSSKRLIDEINLQLGFSPDISEAPQKETAIQKVSSSNKKAKTTQAKSVKESLPDLRALKDKTVFIVDDDMRNIFAITAIMEGQDIPVETALNGKEALQKLDQGLEPDLILMDIMMPEMDGIETITRIRKDQKKQNIPIIAITAKAMADDRDKCLEAGADEYLSKPLNTQLLLETMCRCIEERK